MIQRNGLRLMDAAIDLSSQGSEGGSLVESRGRRGKIVAASDEPVRESLSRLDFTFSSPLKYRYVYYTFLTLVEFPSKIAFCLFIRRIFPAAVA